MSLFCRAASSCGWCPCLTHEAPQGAKTLRDLPKVTQIESLRKEASCLQVLSHPGVTGVLHAECPLKGSWRLWVSGSPEGASCLLRATAACKVTAWGGAQRFGEPWPGEEARVLGTEAQAAGLHWDSTSLHSRTDASETLQRMPGSG